MEKALNEYFKLITDPEEKEKAQQDMTIFKSLFPKGQIKKNEHMIFSVRNNKMVIQFRVLFFFFFSKCVPIIKIYSPLKKKNLESNCWRN